MSIPRRRGPVVHILVCLGLLSGVCVRTGSAQAVLPLADRTLPATSPVQLVRGSAGIARSGVTSAAAKEGGPGGARTIGPPGQLIDEIAWTAVQDSARPHHIGALVLGSAVGAVVGFVVGGLSSPHAPSSCDACATLASTLDAHFLWGTVIGAIVGGTTGWLIARHGDPAGP